MEGVLDDQLNPSSNNDCNSCTFAIIQGIPKIMSRITSELDAGDIASPINRPVLRAIGNFLSCDVAIGQELMYDEKFQTFLLQVLFEKERNHFKKECLWILSNILAGPSEHNFEFITDNKSLLQ